MHMQYVFGMLLSMKPWATTTMFTSSLMCFSLLTFLKNLERLALDPAYYYTTPGLAWDAALRMSKITLELITDMDIYNMIDTSIHGGVSMISTRHAKANNPSLLSYDPEIPRRDLIYLAC